MLKYEKRLRTLAHRAGLYRLHLTRLWGLQGTYTAEWEGSHAQLQELVTLWSRTDPATTTFRRKAGARVAVPAFAKPAATPHRRGCTCPRTCTRLKSERGFMSC